jgi:hypothetical protein
MEFLNGIAALAAFVALVLLWGAASLAEQLVVESALASIRLLLRLPLHLIDRAARSWLFLLSSAYRRQQIAALESEGPYRRGVILLDRAFSALCGVALLGLLIVSFP